MKKILLLLMFSMFCIPWAVNAQETLTVHDGTATSAFVPVYGYYADTYLKCEMVYPAIELSDIDGGTITSMTFYASSPASDSWGSANFQVFLTEVVDATISAYVGSGTVVYEGALDGTQNEMTITFTTPYVYHGGNLLVGVYSTATGSYESVTWTGEAVTGASITGYGNSGLDGIGAEQRNFLPKTTFEYTPAVGITCNKPTNVVVNYEDFLSTATWEGEASLYNIDVNGTVINGVTSPYTFAVEPNATYTVKVQADCGDGNLSGWAFAPSFTTPCAAFALPYSYGFEEASDMSCWNVIGATNSNTGIATITTAAEGSNVFNFYFVETNAYLISPVLDGTSNGVNVMFRYMNSSATTSYIEQFQVGYTTNAGETNPTAFTYSDTIYGQNEWVAYEKVFPANTKRIAIKYIYTDGYYLRLDDFSFETPSGCQRPTNLAVSEVGIHTATLSWTENGVATAWKLKFNGELVENVTNPYTLDDLIPETAYTVSVSPACEEEKWSNEISFTTPSVCDVPSELGAAAIVNNATLNWTGYQNSYNVRYRTATVYVTVFEDDFENGLGNWTFVTDGEIPYGQTEGWSIDEPSDVLGAAHSGNNVASSWSWQSNNSFQASNWLITPRIQLGGVLTYYIKTNSDYPDHYEVLLSTSDNDTASFARNVLLPLSASVVTTGEWEEINIDLSQWAGQQGYIAIHHIDYDANYLFIDDFRVYNIVDAGDWTTVTANKATLAVDHLTPETEYEWQVQGVNADCDNGLTEWSEIATFATASACDVPSSLAAEVDGTIAILNWNAYQDNFNLKYRKRLTVDPASPATITFIVPDVWEDGTGYQMLLDADANTYGTIIPETGGLTTGGDVPAETYAEFEYKIPANADGALTTENVLINRTVTIEIPAGTYDWCITNPTPNDRVWIAAENGTVGGRQDDFVFESGVTYEFTLGLFGSNDGVDLTVILPMDDWVVVENVTPPYELTGLDPETYYEWQVEGVNADCDNALLSETANFTTGEAPLCSTITLPYEETFETYTTDYHLYTFVTPDCWTVAHEYTSASINHIGLEADTLPQLYRAFNHTPDGHYSLRMKFRSILAMPELDGSVDLNRLRLQMYVRQPQTYYKLQVGLMTELGNPDSFVPVALVNNGDKTMTYFECGFKSALESLGDYEHLYIAFKNIGGSANDPYCSNYLDDITLTYVDSVFCVISEIPYVEDFESYHPEIETGATGMEPDCWEVIPEDVALSSVTKPQLYGGFNMEDGELSDDGAYSLRLKNRCVYAMPALSEDFDIQDLTMTFSLRQTKFPYRLQVGVVNNDGEFELVKTINLPVNDPVQEVLVDFAEYEGNGNRIAFRNTTNSHTTIEYSTNYIDDIYIDLTSEFEGKNVANDGNVIDSKDAYLESIAVYPNPTTGNLYIDAMGIQKVECYNQMGQLVRVYDNVLNSIDLNNLSEGVYTLRITVPQGVTMRKVVKK